MNQLTNQFKKDIIADKRISVALMSSYAILTIQYLILYYFNLMGSALGNVIQIASKTLVGFLFLIGLSAVLRRNKILFIITYTVSVGIFLYNYLVFSQNVAYLKSIIFPFFFTCLPCFLYSFSLKDKKIFIDIMKKVSNIVFTIGILILILILLNKLSLGSYSMSLSYYMLLPTISYLNEFIRSRKIIFIILFILSIVTILALGARGPLMCIGIFVFIYIITRKPRFNYKTLLQIFVSLILFVLIFMSLSNIIIYLYNFLINLGINSRTLYLIIVDELSSSTSRKSLYIEVIELIKDNPILGIGIGGDRYYTGMYSHNIFLEILSGFGIIIGSSILILLGLLFYKIIKLKDKDDNNLMIIWTSIGLAPLLISGSYLTDFHFWIFLGLGLNYISDKDLLDRDGLKNNLPILLYENLKKK